eukprot:5874983-Amphidinium_carterae.1
MPHQKTMLMTSDVPENPPNPQITKLGQQWIKNAGISLVIREYALIDTVGKASSTLVSVLVPSFGSK